MVRRKGRRRRPVRLAIVNHKGGVGKTSLSVNLAFALSEMGKRVLLVDADPQCNATSYLVEDSVVDDMLSSSDSANGRTIWSGLKPLIEGTGSIRDVTPLEVSSRRGALFLLVGDIRLAEVEADMAQMWVDCFLRKPRAFAVIHALSSLVARVSQAEKIDVVIYDSAPSIGTLNKVVTLDSDYFIIPSACDLFSVRAIKTLGHAVATWMSDCRTIAAIAPDGVELLSGQPELLGYVLQRVRVYGQEIVSKQAKYIPRIEQQVSSGIVDVLREVGGRRASPATLRLGVIDDLGSLMTEAQRQGYPAWAANGTESQKAKAKAVFDRLGRQVLKRVGL